MSKIVKDKRILQLMIEIYCSANHQSGALCDNCSSLLEYSVKRLENCKFGEKKPSCRKCTVHCYRPDMREQIRQVMRYSGPRMIFYSPFEAIRHLFS